MRGIVITTSEHTKDWLKECFDSIPDMYPVLIVSNGGYKPEIEGTYNVINDWNGFELGGILRGAEIFTEFVHLMDTCVLKEPKLLDMLFDYEGSVHLSPGFYSYLGKYKKSVLDAIGIPKIDNKEAAITAEHHWNMEYLKLDPNALQFDPVLPIQSEIFEIKHGRQNMVLYNGLITKYKGTWR